MKILRYTIFTAAALTLASCSDIDNLQPQGGTLLSEQVKEINTILPERAEASFSGMYVKLGQPLSLDLWMSERPDDFGFIMMAFSNDAEGADLVLPDTGYNWFSVCGNYTSRNADYANPFIRYSAAYNEIALANTVISSYAVTENTPKEVYYNIAQAKAVRAFTYLNLAPYYQFNYQIAKDKPCVPIVTEATTDFANNPRATVEEVYKLIVDDLTYAIEKLDGYKRPDKSKIDQQVAYGLRARAYLDMGMWAEAASDAEKAAVGYTPATIEEVSVPSFYKIAEHNWIWGYDMTVDQAQRFTAATSSAWLRSLSGDSYAAATQNYARCNTLLYNKIPATDVRKNWWVDEDLYSPLLDKISWDGKSGKDLANLEITNTKLAFLPYTNVKFGMYTVGGTTNEEDWPFMRVEEMLLIRAEALYRSGQQEEGKKVLSDFVKTYRDTDYNVNATGRKFEDEVWFQRRVELWGEGFACSDARRLNKPLVRFHDNAESTNMPAKFRFNMKADDGWLLLRFTTSELNTNFAVVDNNEGSLPVQDQNPELRDGVTD